jgi:hypothetical protein
MKVGDLVKYHSAGRPPRIITVLGIVRQHGHEWAKGLEARDTKQRLYDIEHCEVISESR